MKKIIIILMACLLAMPTSFAEDQPSIWAQDFVEELEAYKAIKPEAFKNFQDNITRAEFVYLAVKMIEIVNDEEIILDKSIKFSDTDDIYALKGASAGITSGIGGGKFGPNMLLTREQMATLLINTLDKMGMKTVTNQSYKFLDEKDFSDWSKEAIYLVKANDIMNGVGNDAFDAKGYTKTEAALVVVTKLIRKNIHKIDETFVSQMTKNDLATDIKVSDKVIVNMEKILISEKPSQNTVTFTYSQKNISNEDLAEASLRVYFKDGHSELIKGFSRYYDPGTTKYRTLSLNYDKSRQPLFVIIETSQIDINLNLKTMAKWQIK